MWLKARTFKMGPPFCTPLHTHYDHYWVICRQFCTTFDQARNQGGAGWAKPPGKIFAPPGKMC